MSCSFQGPADGAASISNDTSHHNRERETGSKALALKASALKQLTHVHSHFTGRSNSRSQTSLRMRGEIQSCQAPRGETQNVREQPG